MPEWIRKIKEEQDTESKRMQEALKASALLSALIKSEGSEMWRQLVKELSLTVQFCKDIGVEVIISDISRGKDAHADSDTSAEAGSYRITVSSVGLPSLYEIKSLYVDVGYAPEEGGIKCYPIVGESFEFRFCLHQNRLALCRKGKTVTPEAAANQIVEPLANLILGRRQHANL
jgi:hypothetical protein